MSSTSNREEAADYRSVVALLNEDWRIILCRAGIQWIMQRKGSKRAGADRWTSVAFHRFRDGMIASVQVRCGEVSDDAMALVRRLPERAS